MARKSHLLSLLLFLALVLLVKVSRQTFRWYAYADERGRIVSLREELEEAGVDVVRTRAALDTLRAEIDLLDQRLEQERQTVLGYEDRAVSGFLPPRVYRDYRTGIQAYNETVRTRNRRIEEWDSVVDRNHSAVDEYNRLADSIRELARTMGAPLYDVPSPVEIAVDLGVLQADSLDF